MDRGEGWTTRIGSSRALTQVQVGAGFDHHRRRSERDRDLGSILAVILGVDASRTTDSIGGGGRGSGGYFSSCNRPPAQPNSSGPLCHAFPTSYLPNGYASAPVDRVSLSRWETPPHQRYEEQGGYELANYAGAGYGDGSSGGAEGGYDYSHLSGGDECH